MIHLRVLVSRFHWGQGCSLQMRHQILRGYEVERSGPGQGFEPAIEKQLEMSLSPTVPMAMVHVKKGDLILRRSMWH